MFSHLKQETVHLGGKGGVPFYPSALCDHPAASDQASVRITAHFLELFREFKITYVRNMVLSPQGASLEARWLSQQIKLLKDELGFSCFYLNVLTM